MRNQAAWGHISGRTCCLHCFWVPWRRRRAVQAFRLRRRLLHGCSKVVACWLNLLNRQFSHLSCISSLHVLCHQQDAVSACTTFDIRSPRCCRALMFPCCSLRCWRRRPRARTGAAWGCRRPHTSWRRTAACRSPPSGRTFWSEPRSRCPSPCLLTGCRRRGMAAWMARARRRAARWASWPEYYFTVCRASTRAQRTDS